MVQNRIAEINGGEDLAIAGDNIATDIMEGKTLDLMRVMEHLIVVEHLIVSHSGEQADNTGFIGTDDEVIALLFGLRVRSHIFLKALLLIRDGDNDVAIFLGYLRWGIGLPEGFILLQCRIKVHEVEEMVVCLFHCLNMRLEPGWLSPISSRRM